jgi:hypothetical protein
LDAGRQRVGYQRQWQPWDYRGRRTRNWLKNSGHSFDGSAHIDLLNFTFSGAAYTISIWVRTTNPVSVNDFRSMCDELDNSTDGGLFELAKGGNSLGQNIGPSYLAWNGGVIVVNLEQPALNIRDGRWHVITATDKNGRQQLLSTAR